MMAEALAVVASKAPTALVELADPGTLVPSLPVPTKRQFKVLLDPGHSEKHPGARGKNANVQEEDLNRLQAETLKVELEKYGVLVDIFDPIDDDLWLVGKKAQGYDAFVSLHLNAAIGKDVYSCAMVHPKYQSSIHKGTIVASEWAQEVAKALDMPVFSGTKGYPKGVYATGLSVLSGAANTNCPIFFLSEAFFVDAYNDYEICKKKAEMAMKAGAKVLIKGLNAL
jgi:N-acetylmuramoyl-L-alanine amidase